MEHLHEPCIRSTDTARELRTFFCVFAHMHWLAWVSCSAQCRHLSVISLFLFSCVTRPLLLSSLLFLDGHFETTPDYDLADFDVQDFLPNFPDLKAQFKRTPHEDEKFGSQHRL